MSKFDLSGVVPKWLKIGRKPGVAQESKSEPDTLEQITFSFGIPSKIDEVFAVGRRTLQFVHYLPTIVFTPLATALWFWGKEIPGMVFAAVVMFCQAWRFWWRKRSAIRECEKILARRSEGDTRPAGVLFYGRPKGVFYTDRFYWDTGLIEAEGGLKFEGKRHSFALGSDHITRTQLWPINNFSEAFLEIEWRTVNNQHSSIFIMDIEHRGSTALLKKWVDQIPTRGKTYTGALPVDCSQFPPFKTGKSFLWKVPLAAVIWGGCAYLLANLIRIESPDDKNAFFAITIGLMGLYTHGLLFLFNSQKRATKLADQVCESSYLTERKPTE